jgi:hypothetical protein
MYTVGQQFSTGGNNISQPPGNWSRADLARCFFVVFFYTIVANIPFWTASPLLGLMRNGLFCVEYAGLGVLAFYLPRVLTALIFVLVAAADMLCGVSQTFYLPPSQCLRNATALFDLSFKRLLLILVTVVITVALGIFSALLPTAKIRGRLRLATMMCLALFAVLLVSVDSVSFVRGTGRIPNPFRLALAGDSANISYFERYWYARLPLIRLVRNEFKSAGVNNEVLAADSGAHFMGSAASEAFRSAKVMDTAGKGGVAPDLVLVLVESWGDSSDAVIRNALVQPYLQPDILRRYEVSQGTVPFEGPTVGGEARELCHSSIGFHLLDAPSGELQACIPEQLSALGYRTTAVHGMEGHMFNRSSWYRTVGFQQEWFRTQFKQAGLPDCAGAFTGTCDAAVAEWIGRRLAKTEGTPEFLYWVTLNSHLPVPTPPPLPTPASCSISPALLRRSALCSWYQLIANVHDSMSRVAVSELARPTIFIIVGDHAPGFSDQTIRAQFSYKVVPYVLLIPHNIGG